MAKCMLFGENFSIPDSYIRNFVMNKRSCQYAEAAEEEFNVWYEKCSGMHLLFQSESRNCMPDTRLGKVLHP